MVPSLLVLTMLVLASVWLFAKASNEQDEFAGLVGHGVVAVACFVVAGLGVRSAHSWIWVAAGVAFLVNAVFLFLRIRHV